MSFEKACWHYNNIYSIRNQLFSNRLNYFQRRLRALPYVRLESVNKWKTTGCCKRHLSILKENTLLFQIKRLFLMYVIHHNQDNLILFHL